MIPINIFEWIAKKIQKLEIKWIITYDIKLLKEKNDWEWEYNIKNPVTRYQYWYKKVIEGNRTFIIFNAKEIDICSACWCSINSVADTMNMKWKVYCKGCYYDKFDTPKVRENIRKSK